MPHGAYLLEVDLPLTAIFYSLESCNVCFTLIQKAVSAFIRFAPKAENCWDPLGLGRWPPWVTRRAL